MVYDGILSLGCWCQMGGILHLHGLKAVNTPLDNFGLREWQRLADILESEFYEYWELHNMSIGKTNTYFSLKHNEERELYKVYCNKYNMVSTHHFDIDTNTGEELKVYPEFREKMDVLIEIFLRQCENYEKVLFMCKVLSYPEASTHVKREDVRRLCQVLDVLRKGRPYDLRISVPKEHWYDLVCEWVKEDGLEHVKVYPWTVDWNIDKNHEDWVTMLEGVALAPDYNERIFSQIIGNPELDHRFINYINR